MAWDDIQVDDGAHIDYSADHNELVNRVKARLTGSLGLATPNAFVIVNAGGTGATPVGLTSVTTLGADDTTLPTSKAVKDVTDLKSPIANPTFTGEVTAPILKLTTGPVVGALLTNADAAGHITELTSGANTTVLVGTGVGSSPAWGADLPTAVTIGSQYIYRAAGTDVPVTDGGTGVSTLTDGGLLCGNAGSAIEALPVGASTQILVGVAGATPTWTTATGTGAPARAGSPTFTGIIYSPAIALTSSTPVGALLTNADNTGNITKLTGGATTTILVGGGTSASPVWTAATGTGAPVRAGDPTFTGTVTLPILKVTTGASSGWILLSSSDGTLSYNTPAKRTLWLSCAGGWASTTYGDGGFTTTEATTTAGATSTTFNLKGTFFDAVAADRNHEFSLPMPNNWDGGTVSASPYFMVKSPPTTGQQLILGIAGAILKTGYAATACVFGLAASTFFSLTGSDANKVYIGASATPSLGSTAITIGCTNGSPAGGDLVQWKVSRSYRTDYSGGATVLGWMITYGTKKYSDEV